MRSDAAILIAPYFILCTQCVRSVIDVPITVEASATSVNHHDDATAVHPLPAAAATASPCEHDTSVPLVNSRAARNIARQLGSYRPGEQPPPLEQLLNAVTGKRQRRQSTRTASNGLVDCANIREQAELQAALKNSGAWFAMS